MLSIPSANFLGNYFDVLESIENGFLPWQGKYSLTASDLVNEYNQISQVCRRCQTRSESLLVARSFTLSLFLSGAMMCLATSRSNTTNTSTFIWQTLISPGAFCNKSTSRYQVSVTLDIKSAMLIKPWQSNTGQSHSLL